MDKNGEIYDYSSFVYYQNNLNIKNNKRIIQFNNILNDYNNYSNVIKKFNTSVNNPLFKENNFFLKSNNTNKSSRLINKTKKITRLKNYYNNLIPLSNKNFNDITILHKKINKSLNNNQCTINRMNNYYSNIYINDNYHQQNLTTNTNKSFAHKIKSHSIDKKFNNNSFVTIYSYNNKKDKRCINKSSTNILKSNQPINIRHYQHQKNKSNNPIKYSTSPYYNMVLYENNTTDYNNMNITDYNCYNKANYNNIEYKKSNNIINFNNENINYNNKQNIQKNQTNKTENSISKKIINYNKNNQILYYKNINNNKCNNINNKKNIEINIYPNYQQIKNNEKEITKMNLQKNKICLKCKKLKIKSTQNYNLKEPLINNYAFYERKNLNNKKCYNNNYNTSKAEQNLYSQTNMTKQNEKLNNEKLLSLVRKNYELFLKKNNQFNLNKITNNLKKRKRPKSKNQIDKEKNLDKKKSLSYRESMLLKPAHSTKKNKNSFLNDIARTLSQKKYKEDNKNIINNDDINNIKTVLFNDDHIKKYSDIKLEKQIGCQFSIYKYIEKNNNECFNGVITYFNSENLKNRKIGY